MKLGKALRLVLARWNMSHYALSKASGVGQSTIGKLIRNELQSSTWDVVERLAEGFEKVDPMAKVAFLGVLTLPDSAYHGALDHPDAMFTEPYDSISIEAVNILKERGFLNLEAIERSGFKVEGNEYFENILGESLASEMYQRRRQERAEDAQRRERKRPINPNDY
ncbi:helix-turn-helix transcriptional regulator [Chroococcidiopsis sp. TS-821]|uniref:helix-turn-helix domain-containing protein n=1 Tax=Chroococcidiopsis sp. TS-821 TaxID=1378066 RepID=UPI000CEDB9FD|nr:helix-turn-helix transcriptional regulator [Chroococcidiopsis sp. TS-821]PPS43523.1 hypothetical protein B1A85_12655 [Chroococcidiopsis sp. TS-821]